MQLGYQAVTATTAWFHYGEQMRKVLGIDPTEACFLHGNGMGRRDAAVSDYHWQIILSLRIINANDS